MINSIKEWGNKLVKPLKNMVAATSLFAILALWNPTTTEASPVIDAKPEYVQWDYKNLNYFLDSLGISLPEKLPLELKDYAAEGIFNLNRVEKRVFKEELRKELKNITNEENKQLFFLVFCEYMRNLWFHENRLLAYESKIVEWSKKQGMKKGKSYEVSCSFLIHSVYNDIFEEYRKEINPDLDKDKNKNDDWKSG